MIVIAEKTFKKSFKRLVKKSPQLQGLWSCSVTYSYRIIFTFRRDPELDEDVIVLIEIGDHDEVY